MTGSAPLNHTSDEGLASRGPWRFRQIDTDGLGYIEDADGRDIMHAGVTDRPTAENIANSHLTAAALDMFEAGSAVLAWWNAKIEKELASHKDFPWAEDAEWAEFHALRAALRKAQGGEA